MNALRRAGFEQMDPAAADAYARIDAGAGRPVAELRMNVTLIVTRSAVHGVICLARALVEGERRPM